MTAQSDISTVLRYKPVGITHIAIMGIVGVMLTAIDYILIGIGHATTTADIESITLGNIIISVSNAYWLVKLSINAKGLQESTSSGGT